MSKGITPAGLITAAMIGGIGTVVAQAPNNDVLNAESSHAIEYGITDAGVPVDSDTQHLIYMFDPERPGVQINIEEPLRQPHNTHAMRLIENNWTIKLEKPGQ